MDLERLQYCCVPVIDGGKAIPFCAYNLSSRDGRSLYRGKAKMSGTSLSDKKTQKRRDVTNENCNCG
jgi:uncharacterized radical SAM superfamily Fe-S cluster-containing enzyme